MKYIDFKKLNIVPNEKIYIIDCSNKDNLFTFQNITESCGGYRLTLQNKRGVRKLWLSIIESIERWDDICNKRQSEIKERLRSESLYSNCDKDIWNVMNVKNYIKKSCPLKSGNIELSEAERLLRVMKLFGCNKPVGSCKGCKDQCRLENKKVYNYLEHLNEYMNSKSNFNQKINIIEILSSYILGYYYSEKRLKQQYYDGSLHKNSNGKKEPRQYNIVSFSCSPEVIQGRRNGFSDLESIENAAYKYKYKYLTHIDNKSIVDYPDVFTDDIEKNIVVKLSEGHFKKDIAAHYRLSEQTLKTMIKHINKCIDEYNNPKQIPTTKICSRCGKEKPLSAYGKNSRRTDMLQTFCKACSQKKNKIY